MRVPEVLRRNATLAWGADGDRWLAGLPWTLAGLAADWGLDLGEPYELTYHWVTRARTRDGRDVVLKLGPPGSDDLVAEATTLAAWAGSGAVRLLRSDLRRGALLLERAVPGTPASALADDQAATAAAVGVARRLHAVPLPGHGVPTLRARLDALGEHLADPARDALVPRPLVERARAVAAELLASAPPARLLHGDLHHDNVLRAERGWLAIDPHGVVGDPGYEAGAWLYNPWGSPVARLLPRRLEQLADGLGQPLARVTAWGFVQAVLSAVWTAQGGVRAEGAPLDVAALLQRRLG